MNVCGFDLQAAVQWIASRYKVPDAPKGKHIQHQERWPERFRVGTSSALEMLVRSGIWASLTPAQRSIVPVLDTFSDPQTREVTISYRGIMRYAGVRRRSTVSGALKRFRALRFLCVESTRDSEGLRACNRYRLSFDDPDFSQLASECRQKHVDQIKGERALRKNARAMKRATRVLPVNTLSNGWSSVEFHAPISRTVK